MYGSVRGAARKGGPYRDQRLLRVMSFLSTVFGERRARIDQDRAFSALQTSIRWEMAAYRAAESRFELAKRIIACPAD